MWLLRFCKVQLTATITQQWTQDLTEPLVLVTQRTANSAITTCLGILLKTTICSVKVNVSNPTNFFISPLHRGHPAGRNLYNMYLYK